MKTNNAVMTTGQVAKYCNVAPRTVSKWFDSGLLKGFRIPGSKDRRIQPKDLLAFLREHGMPLGNLDLTRRILYVGSDPILATALAEAIEWDVEIMSALSMFDAGLQYGDCLVKPEVLIADVPKSAIERADLNGMAACGTTMVWLVPVGDHVVKGWGHIKRPFELVQLVTYVKALFNGAEI